MDVYEKIYKMNTVFGIWNYSKRLRITYVSQGWLIVWDHQQTPPTRYDCQSDNHDDACTSVMNKLGELATLKR